MEREWRNENRRRRRTWKRVNDRSKQCALAISKSWSLSLSFFYSLSFHSFILLFLLSLLENVYITTSRTASAANERKGNKSVAVASSPPSSSSFQSWRKFFFFLFIRASTTFCCFYFFLILIFFLLSLSWTAWAPAGAVRSHPAPHTFVLDLFSFPVLFFFPMAHFWSSSLLYFVAKFVCWTDKKKMIHSSRRRRRVPATHGPIGSVAFFPFAAAVAPI